jgi:hypothetical protein
MDARISDSEYKVALNRAAVERSGVGTTHGSQAIGENIDCVAFSNAIELFVGKGWGEIMPTPSTCFHPKQGGSCVLVTPDGRRKKGVTCDLQTPWNSQKAEKLKATIYESLKG